jgi:large subunit ribosomal protein L3
LFSLPLLVRVFVMSVGLIGKKIGMTQVYDSDGVIVPVTVIEAGPCVVTQVRTLARDGYSAVQLGFGQLSRGKASRARRGHVAQIGGRRQAGRPAEAAVPKADCEPPRWLREFRTTDDAHGFTVGQKLQPSLLQAEKFVDVIGVSRGRGFSGGMRRHNFHGQPASHGAKRVHRKRGSVGASADPSRVLPGTRMAGHYGAERVTSRNLRVVRADDENNLLLVRGAVPGPDGAFVIIRRSAKKVRS